MIVRQNLHGCNHRRAHDSAAALHAEMDDLCSARNFMALPAFHLLERTLCCHCRQEELLTLPDRTATRIHHIDAP
jgi:hypothetical protein